MALSPAAAKELLLELQATLDIQLDNKSFEEQFYALFAGFIVTAVLLLITLAVKLFRWRAFDEQLWLIKRVRRPKGVYLVPHGSYCFSIKRQRPQQNF